MVSKMLSMKMKQAIQRHMRLSAPYSPQRHLPDGQGEGSGVGVAQLDAASWMIFQ